MQYYIRSVTANELVDRACSAAKVMHPDYIWTGLCNQLKRTPSIEEWNKVIEATGPQFKQQPKDKT